MLPAVVVAIVANITLDRGLDRLFSGPTRAAIENSLNIAHAYVNEHAYFQQHFVGMTSADTSAAPFDPSLAERKG